MQRAGYYDMHTHIIPTFDDGSQDMEMTKRMLEISYKQGIRHICATSHFNSSLEGRTKELKDKYEELKEYMASAYPDVEIRLGTENAYGIDLVEHLREGKALTIAGSRYVLVEFAIYERYSAIYGAVRKLVDAMYIPIIAHVERYIELEKKDERIKELIDAGAYMQLNTSGLLGGMFDKRRRRSIRLLKNGYIHLLGSDCHNDTTRLPVMDEAIASLKGKVSEELLERILFENPKKVFDDIYISV